MMNPRKITSRKTTLLWILLVAVASLPTMAMADSGSWNTNEQNVVLDGYDVVAYHHQDQAIRGQARFSATHDGVTFHFSGQENLDAFRVDPAKYLPTFGGFCAFGVAANKAKVPTNPETFKIYNGDLLLFFNDLYQDQPVNTKVMWNQNESDLYGQATATWKTLN